MPLHLSFLAHLSIQSPLRPASLRIMLLAEESNFGVLAEDAQLEGRLGDVYSYLSQRIIQNCQQLLRLLSRDILLLICSGSWPTVVRRRSR